MSISWSVLLHAFEASLDSISIPIASLFQRMFCTCLALGHDRVGEIDEQHHCLTEDSVSSNSTRCAAIGNRGGSATHADCLHC